MPSCATPRGPVWWAAVVSAWRYSLHEKVDLPPPNKFGEVVFFLAPDPSCCFSVRLAVQTKIQKTVSFREEAGHSLQGKIKNAEVVEDVGDVMDWYEDDEMMTHWRMFARRRRKLQ